MKLRFTLFATALMVLTTSTATVFAADEATAVKTDAAKTETGEAAKSIKKKMNRHSHPVDKGVMPPSSADVNPPSSDSQGEKTEPKKPVHDHRKEMKGG